MKKCYSTLILTLVLTAYLPAQYFDLTWENSRLGFDVGTSNLIVKDLDKDGKNEVLVGSYNNSSAYKFSVYEYKDNTYKIKWTSKIYASPIRALASANLDSDSQEEICVLLGNGTLEMYDSKTRIVQSTKPTGVLNANKLLIADMDKNGSTEILILNNTTLAVFNSAVENKQTVTVIGGKDMKIGNVDDDADNEIVISTGDVISSTSLQVKSNFGSLFGDQIELADYNNDSRDEVIALTPSMGLIIAYNYMTKTNVWQVYLNKTIASFILTDIDNDNVKEIVTGLASTNEINCFEPNNSVSLWSIKDNPTYGACSLCKADPDNDGKSEYIWCSGNSVNTTDQFMTADAETKNIEWKVNNAGENGPFFVTISDVDNDGADEIIKASSQSNNNVDGGIIEIYNSSNYTLKRTIKVNRTILSIAAGNVNSTPQGELVVGTFGPMVIYDAVSGEKISEDGNAPDASVIKLGDIDNDGQVEIVTGFYYTGLIKIFDGSTGTEEWVSSTIANPVYNLALANVDNDPYLEVVFMSDVNKIQIYDGKDHTLQNQINNITNVSSMDIGYLNGTQVLAAGKSNGNIAIINARTLASISDNNYSSASIDKIKIANIDSTASEEIIAASSSLMIFSSAGTKIWDSETSLSKTFAPMASLFVYNLHNDRHTDLFVGNDIGVFQFTARSESPDIIPPYIKEYFPPQSLTPIATNKDITVLFSEPMDVSTLYNNILVKVENGAVINTSVAYNTTHDQIVIDPVNLLPVNSKIVVKLSSGIKDSAGNRMDGNLNGISEGSPADDYSWYFFTGTGTDNIGPKITSVSSTKDSVWKGRDIRIDVVTSDTSSIAISTVKGVEYFIDVTKTSGTGIALLPNDGKFDEITESAYGLIKTGNLTAGKHKIYLHAKDSLYNWGSYVEKQISVVYMKDPSGSWSMYQGNACHTGVDSTNSITLPLGLVWKKTYDPGQRISQCAVGNNFVFTAANNPSTTTDIFATRYDNGSTQWGYSLGKALSADNLAYAYGILFVQTGNPNTLTAFNSTTGAILWRDTINSQWVVSDGPVVADGKVFVNDGTEQKLIAYDVFSGERIWETQIPGIQGQWSPAYYGKNLYIGKSGETFIKVGADSGNVIYNNGVFNPGNYTPAIAHNMLVTRDSLCSISLTSTAKAWGKNGYNMPALYGESIYVMEPGYLKVYDQWSGSFLWDLAINGSTYSEPAISNNLLFVSADDVTYAVNLTTKNIVWTYNIGGKLAISNGRLFITSGNSLYILKSGVTAVENEKENSIPSSFALQQNYPNPFNPSTRIQYAVGSGSVGNKSQGSEQLVTLKVYDILGNEIATLVNEHKAPGYYEVEFNGSNLATGVYIYKLTAGSFVSTKKLILLK